MHWFKIVLLAIIGVSVVVGLYNVGKPQKEPPTPFTNAIGAIVNTLLLVGILIYL